MQTFYKTFGTSLPARCRICWSFFVARFQKHLFLQQDQQFASEISNVWQTQFAPLWTSQYFQAWWPGRNSMANLPLKKFFIALGEIWPENECNSFLILDSCHVNVCQCSLIIHDIALKIKIFVKTGQSFFLTIFLSHCKVNKISGGNPFC